jgi:hypothetical protein
MWTARALLPAFVAGVVLAAVPGRAEAGGCRGFLEWRPGRGGKAAPNAGLLFTGYTFDDPTAKVTAAGKSLAAKVEKWGFDEGRCGQHYFLVRPASGTWPKGAKMVVDLGEYGKHDVVIGTALDKTAPTAKVFGPWRKKDPSSEMRVIPWAGVRDDESAVVLLRNTFADHAMDVYGERRVIRGPEAGELEYSRGCAALVLVDTAGNEKRFPDACR